MTFSEMIQHFCHDHYKPMCVNTLMIQIKEKYEIILNIVRQIIKKNKCKGSLYIDGLKSRNNYHFTGLIYHFLDKNLVPQDIVLAFCEIKYTKETRLRILSSIEEQLAWWNINIENISALISDNGPNIYKMGHELETKYPNVSFIRCAPHTLQLIINHALKNIYIDLIAQVRGIVTKINHGFFKYYNVIGSKFLREYKRVCIEMNIHPNIPKSDVSTQWNSTYYMIQSVLNMDQPLRKTYVNIEEEYPITFEQKEYIIDLFHFLKLCESVSQFLEGDKNTFISDLIPLIHILYQKISIFSPTTEPSKYICIN